MTAKRDEELQALRASEENSRQMLEQARDAIRTLERDGEAKRGYFEHVLNMLPVGLGIRRNVSEAAVVDFENNTMKRMFARYKKAQLRWHDPVDPRSISTRVTLDDTGVYAEERTYPDDRVYQFTLSYYRNLDDTWSEVQLVRDVTKRVRLEKALEASHEDLEERVEQRTLEVRQKQAQLVQSEKMATLGNLVAGVAHEINTPLGALKSNNDLFTRSMTKIKTILAGDGVPSELKDNPQLAKLMNGIDGLQDVNKNALKRIVTIVGSLRKFARLDEAERDEVDLHDGLESTLALVHHELKNRVDAQKDYGDIPRIYCYPNQINQVFMNILVNAAQAIDGKGEIFIKTYRRGDNAVVEFRDTGKGIPRESIDRIWDPGFTTKGAGVGTGLGLSIVYQIMQDHKGDIEVESEIGKGTTMRVILPIGQKEEQ